MSLYQNDGTSNARSRASQVFSASLVKIAGLYSVNRSFIAGTGTRKWSKIRKYTRDNSSKKTLNFYIDQLHIHTQKSSEFRCDMFVIRVMVDHNDNLGLGFTYDPN